MHQKPAYILSSIDNALELIQLLRDTGQLRLSDAAKSLEISNSTAHRLMAMLVYRGFAIQGDDRVYLPGPSMGERAAMGSHALRLKHIVQPHLETLASSSAESAI